MMSWPWNELGLTGPVGPEEVKHAYAQRLKEVHPEEDPEGFQRLHRAYQMARRLSRTAGGSAAAPPESEVSVGSSDARQGTSSPEEAQLDFDTLLAQGEAETEPDEEDPEDEFSEAEYAWVPPVYREPLSRQPRPSSGRAIFVLIPILLLIMAILNWPSLFHGDTAAKAAKTQQWLEHTFQIQLVSSSENRNREEDRFLYWLKDDPDVRFQGIWSEDGDFQTNYPNVRLFWEMRAFAQEWPDYPLWFDQEMTDQVG